MSTSLTTAVQHFQEGRLGDAERACNEALQENAEDFHALHLMGVLKSKSGNTYDAVTMLERALEVNPDLVEARFNLGIGYRDLEKYDEAIEVFSCVKDSWPNRADVFTELALCLSRAGRPAEALEAYESASDINGATPQILASMANLYGQAGDFEKAEDLLKRALDLNPAYVPVHVNLGTLRTNQGRTAEALEIYKNALNSVGDDPDVLMRHALTLLTLENFSDGWPLYARRGPWPMTQSSHGQCQAPYWAGENLTDPSLLVWTEQGPGDEILIASMVPELQTRVGHLVLACSARMAPVFERSFPWCDVVVRNDTDLPESCRHDIDWQASLTELGAVLRRSLDQFPAHNAFLASDAAATQNFKSKYTATGQGKPLVGISWRSSLPITFIAALYDFSLSVMIVAGRP